MHLHIRGDRPFSLIDKFNYFDVALWRASLCLLGFLTLGVANHVVQTARYFQMQDRQGIVDESPYREIYDFVRGVLEGKDDVDAGRADDGQRASWEFISPRLRILYGDDFGRVREC